MNRSDFVIETDKLTRSFNGIPALNGLTLRVSRGSIYGFLGRNGSGKTTAIKILAGLLRPDSGTARVFGLDPFTLSPADRCRVGYMSEKQILPPNARVRSLLSFCSRLHPRWDHALARRLIEHYRISPKSTIRSLSNGTQRQVAFILALAQKPELLILDEPASTLDTVARREFLDELLALLRNEEVTVLLSSHILSDIERVADHIGIIANGRLQVSEPLDELKEHFRQVRFHSFATTPTGDFPLPGAVRIKRSTDEMQATGRFGDDAVITEAARAIGAKVEITPLPLEEIFIELSRY